MPGLLEALLTSLGVSAGRGGTGTAGAQKFCAAGSKAPFPHQGGKVAGRL